MRNDAAPGSSSAASATPFSTSTIPTTCSSVARRVATVTRPNAISASAARSTSGDASPNGGISHASASASATASAARASGDTCADTGRGSRVRDTTSSSSDREATARSGEHSGGGGLAAVRRVGGRDGRQRQRLGGDERDREGAAPHDDDAEPERDQ